MINDNTVEELIKQIKDRPDKYWFKPGQIQSWIYCLEIGKPLYTEKLKEIAYNLQSRFYERSTGDLDVLFRSAAEDCCEHYYLNDTDADKIVMMLAKVLKCYYPPRQDDEEKENAEEMWSEGEPEMGSRGFTMGKLVPDWRDNIFDNPANEIKIMSEGRYLPEATPTYTAEEIERFDLEKLSLSLSATCDFMRNGYIVVGDYINRDKKAKEVREESAVEFYNGLVKRRYHGYLDNEYDTPDDEYEGKKKCNILREIRREIAADNDIPYYSEDCTFKGECPGTCPKCDEEIRYLQEKLDERKANGLEVVINRIDPKKLDNAKNTRKRKKNNRELEEMFAGDSDEIVDGQLETPSIEDDEFEFF